jgi:hypothetical protein
MHHGCCTVIERCKSSKLSTISRSRRPGAGTRTSGARDCIFRDRAIGERPRQARAARCGRGHGHPSRVSVRA